MDVIYHLEDIERPLRNPVLSIGNFDGVHIGHLALFDKVKERARAIHGQPAVMTFEPHPIRVMKPGNGPSLITPTDQKLSLIAQAGIEVAFCIPFTHEFAAISARSFVEEILVKKIGVKEIVVGYDYSFGHDREGNNALLQEMGKSLGFTVLMVAPVHVEKTLVSSTSIRRLVQEGELEEARKLLGRDHQVWGKVIKGHGRGEKILGIPTANLEIVDELLPKAGVYVVNVSLEDRIYQGVTNIGCNPTFRNGVLSLETHILGFTGDILGKSIKITFLRRLRDEQRFESVRELSDQIRKDIQEAGGLSKGEQAG